MFFLFVAFSLHWYFFVGCFMLFVTVIGIFSQLRFPENEVSESCKIARECLSTNIFAPNLDLKNRSILQVSEARGNFEEVCCGGVVQGSEKLP